MNLPSLRALVLPAALAILAAGCEAVPYTGRSRVLLVTEEEERWLGEKAWSDARAAAKAPVDPAQAALVQKVGARIAAAAERPDFRWEFQVIEDDAQVNAWCLPGGKVAFYSGILPLCGGEEGVAVVMGHEVAHAIARHGAERMSDSMLAEAGGIALDVLLSERPESTRALYGQMYGAGVALGVMLPFSRDHELEADRIGLILMAKAGYDPARAPEFWERMAAAKGTAGGPLDAFLSTHPTDAERRQRLLEWLPEIRREHYRPR